MVYNIYQIPSSANPKCFMGSEVLPFENGRKVVDATQYMATFTGSEDGGANLEYLWRLHNGALGARPDADKMRSLSVSDVVEIVSVDDDDDAEPGFWFCDHFGWVPVQFDKALAKRPTDRNHDFYEEV